MTKWINKLTKKEIWQLHHDVICEDSLKKCDISNGINEVTEEAEAECTFYENWTCDERNNYIPTPYTFKDFEYTDWQTTGGGWEDQAKYRTWLAKRFGVPYLAELLQYKTGIKVDVFNDILSRKWEEK